MNYAGSHPPNPNVVIDVEYTEVKPKKKHTFWDDLIGYIPPEERLRKEIQKEQSQALLTKVALNHIGMLSVTEQQLSSISPHAMGRYQAIVDSATRKTLQHLADVRW